MQPSVASSKINETNVRLRHRVNDILIGHKVLSVIKVHVVRKA